MGDGEKEQRFAALYAVYIDEIYRYVYLRTGLHQATAEDLTQEIFLDVFKGLERTRYRFGTHRGPKGAHAAVGTGTGPAGVRWSASNIGFEAERFCGQLPLALCFWRGSGAIVALHPDFWQQLHAFHHEYFGRLK